jgi:hypothetical protein
MSAGIIIGNIVKYGPTIAETAGIIYGKIKKHFFHENGSIPIQSDNSLKDLSDRISELEINEVEQAELVQKMANQLNDISIGMKVLYDRIILSFIYSGVAILLAIIALVFCVLK